MRARALAVPHGLVSFIGVALTLGGVWISTHRIPNAYCSQSTDDTTTIRQDLNRYAFIGGLPAIVSGSLALFAGCCGAFGGIQKSKAALRCAAATLVLAVFLGLIAFSAAMSSKAVAEMICESYECSSGAELCTHSACDPAGHPQSSGGEGAQMQPEDSSKNGCSWICQDDYDSICHYGTKSTVAAGTCMLMLFATTITSCMACGAGCFCPVSFEMELPKASQAEFVGHSVVCGQPAQT